MIERYTVPAHPLSLLQASREPNNPYLEVAGTLRRLYQAGVRVGACYSPGDPLNFSTYLRGVPPHLPEAHLNRLLDLLHQRARAIAAQTGWQRFRLELNWECGREDLLDVQA